MKRLWEKKLLIKTEKVNYSLWLYGGLNQVMFRRQFFRFLFSLRPFRFSRNSVISHKPLSAKALSYIGLAFPNAVSSLNISVRRRLMEAGKFLMIFRGGWIGSGYIPDGRLALGRDNNSPSWGLMLHPESQPPLG